MAVGSSRSKDQNHDDSAHDSPGGVAAVGSYRTGCTIRVPPARQRRPERDALPRQLRGQRAWRWPTFELLTASKHVKLVAVADVDLSRTAEVKKLFPDVKVYQDWRELLDKEKSLNSVNVSTPDHMHAPITMRAMQQGLHVYTQKPLDADDLRSPAADARGAARRSSSPRWASRSTRTRSTGRSWRPSRPGRSAR